jgi:hypothetical protein
MQVSPVPTSTQDLGLPMSALITTAFAAPGRAVGI